MGEGGGREFYAIAVENSSEGRRERELLHPPLFLRALPLHVFLVFFFLSRSSSFLSCHSHFHLGGINQEAEAEEREARGKSHLSSEETEKGRERVGGIGVEKTSSRRGPF